MYMGVVVVQLHSHIQLFTVIILLYLFLPMFLIFLNKE